jgi:hypothetical protein
LGRNAETYTDIQTPEMDEKIENIELYKEMLEKNKKNALKLHFFSTKLYYS